jgi:hypothetical protein
MSATEPPTPRISADIVTESGASRASAPWEGVAAHRVAAAPRVHHRLPGRQAIRVHPVFDIPRTRGPGGDQRTVGRYPTRAPGGTAAGPTASPERQDPHARGVLCEPAPPPGAGGHARRPAARRAARPWRGTRGRSWPAPRQRLPAGLCGRLWLSHCRSRKSCLEIHPQQDEHQPSGRCLTNVPCLVEAGTTPYEGLRKAATDRAIWRGSAGVTDCRPPAQNGRTTRPTRVQGRSPAVGRNNIRCDACRLGAVCLPCRLPGRWHADCLFLGGGVVFGCGQMGDANSECMSCSPIIWWSDLVRLPVRRVRRGW